MLPIFYINLDKRPDRKHNIQSQLQQIGILAERIQAVDGASIGKREQEFVDVNKFILRMKRPISQGEIGCAISHRSIWQKMLDEKLEYALIMEDDVIINPSIMNLLTNTQYKSFDFINLSSNEPYHVCQQKLYQMLTADITIRNHHTEKEFKVLDWNNSWKIYQLHRISPDMTICECNISPALGSGYILSQKAAKHFLLASEHLQVPIDYIWRYAGGMLVQGFIADPLITQTENDSDIIGRENVYKLSLKQKLNRFILKHQSNPRKQDITRMYS